MNNQRVSAVALFLIAIALALVSNLLTSEPEIQAWYKSHRLMLLSGSMLLVVLGIVFSLLSIKTEAKQAVDEIDVTATVNGAIWSAVIRGAIGICYGVCIDFLFRHLLNHPHFFPGAAITRALWKVGPLHLSVVLYGMKLGRQFRYLYSSQLTKGTLVDTILGAVTGLALAGYFQPPYAAPFLAVLPLPVAAVVNGVFGTSVGAFTALFKPLYFRRCRNRTYQIQSEHERFEMVRGQLQAVGYKVNSSLPSGNWILLWIVGALLKPEKPEGGEVDPQDFVLKASVLTPPFTVSDEHSKQVRQLNSLDALESFAKGTLTDLMRQC